MQRAFSSSRVSGTKSEESSAENYNDFPIQIAYKLSERCRMSIITARKSPGHSEMAGSCSIPRSWSRSRGGLVCCRNGSRKPRKRINSRSSALLWLCELCRKALGARLAGHQHEKSARATFSETLPILSFRVVRYF